MPLLLLLFFPFFCLAQPTKVETTVQTTALTGTASSLPFWMTRNQSGRYASSANAQSLTEGQVHGSTRWPGRLTLSYGTDLALLVTKETTDAKIIQAYLALSGRVLRLQAGAFAEEELLGGLSSSNGSMVRSLNHRPYPRVRLSTPGFIPVPFTKRRLLFNAQYDEGLLTDERVTERPHLHHKSFFLQWTASHSLRFTLGLDHYVFWGGRSQTLGPLPDRFSDYLRYVTGQEGSSNFSPIDQLNVAGNQLGAYLLAAEKDFDNLTVRLQASHPFDDGSGMTLENARDNLYSLYLRKNKQGTLLDELVMEYLYSKHQSGDRSDEQHLPNNRRHGVDNYFNHGIYATGFTYHGQSMGTPLFEPIREIRSNPRNQFPRNLISGLANNRVSAFHLGARGCLSKAFSWKTLLTMSQNFGTYIKAYKPMRQQFYSMAQLGWQSSKLPLSLSALVGMDIGQLLGDRIGVGCQVQWRF